MDIPVYILGALALVGYNLNRSGKQSRPTENINPDLEDERHENKKAGGANIYNSGYFKKVREIEDEKVINNFEKSFDPLNTNVIPYFFNNLSDTNIQTIPNPKYDSSVLNEQVSKFGINQLVGNLNQLEPRANDMTLLNADGSVESSGFGGITGVPTHDKDITEFFDSPQTLISVNGPEPAVNAGGLGPGQIGGFVHNNMVPFFGGSSRQNMTIQNRNLEGKLEAFTGQMKLDLSHKSEVGPMFQPAQQDIYQQMAPRELDRQVVNLQVRNNEIPFEPIHVGPGLNKGYTSFPTGGFHPTLRVLPKTTDQLYVNPRTTNEGRIIKGRTINKRTAQQKVYKYKPEVLVTNFDGERNFTTVGAFEKPMVHSKQVMKPQERVLSRNVLGPMTYANGSVSTPNNLRQKHKISDKVSFANTPYRNTKFSEVSSTFNGTQRMSAFENKSNERSVTQMRYGMGDGEPVTTSETEYCGTSMTGNQKEPAVPRVLQGVEGFVSGSGRNNRNRNSNNSNNSNRGNNNNNNNNNTEHYTNNDSTPSPANVSNLGKPETISESNKPITFKSLGYFDTNRKFDVDRNEVYLEDLPKTTKKQGTINAQNQYGYNSLPVGLQKQTVYDPNDFMKTTIREQTEDNNYIPIAGQAESGGGMKSYTDAYNMRQNLQKEVISEGRYPTLSSTKLANGKESVIMEIKKIQSDRLNQYAFMRQPTQAFSIGRVPLNDCNLTSVKNNLPSHNTRLDESLTETYEKNALTNSLKSWSTI